MNPASLFENDLNILLPEYFFAGSTILLLSYGVIYSTSSKYAYPQMIRSIIWLSILVLTITGILILNNNTVGTTIINGLLISDYFGDIAKFILLVTTATTLLMSLDYVEKETIRFFEYVILTLLATLGMLFLASSYDLIAMYLAIEFQSLCLYVLAALKRNSLYSVEAGLKYFILGAFSSGILLFGISILYGFTGVTGFEDLSKLLISMSSNDFIFSSGILLGVICIGVGLLFKIYAVPFHVWVPDVYQGSPTIITAYFAIVPSISVFTLIIRFFITTLHDLIEYWQPIFVVCAVASMLLGSIAALSQKRIKRLIAYSAIGHVGYILIGLASGTPEGIRGVLIYIVIYITMSIAFFSILLSLRKTSDNTQLVFLSEFKQLHKSNPVLAISLTIVLFSMAGIPPIAGFFSKLYVFLPAIHEGLYILILIGILASVISAVYYLNLIRIMYFEKADLWCDIIQIDKEKAVVLSVALFLLLFFFIFPAPLVLMSHKAALLVCL